MLALAVSGILAVSCLTATGAGLEALTGSDGWELSGFAKDAVYPIVEGTDDARPRYASFDSWDKSRPNTGKLTSPPFQAPPKLSTLVAGSPYLDGIQIFLEDTIAKDRLALKVRHSPLMQWRRMTWEIPVAWINRTVRFVAVDQSTHQEGWLAVSIPEKGDPPRWPRFRDSMTAAARWNWWLAITAFLFLLPGTAVALWLRARLGLDPVRFASIALIASAGAGYIVFWMYFAQPAVGFYVSLALPPICAVAAWVKRGGAGVHLRELGLAAILSVVAGAFYLNAGSLFLYNGDLATSSQVRYTWWMLPPDNVLPLIFAERVYYSQELRPSILLDWKSSDRPPLQTGLTLAQMPFWRIPREWVAEPPGFSAQHVDLWSHYQVAGVMWQTFWVGAVWLFLAAAGLSPKVRIMILALMMPTVLCTFYSSYVWPKMLPGWLVLLAFGLTPLITRRRPWSAVDGLCAAVAIALAMMAHQGVAMALPGAFAALLAERLLPPRRVLMAGAAAGLAVLAPWQLYQKFYDPPGDRLLKWHLAGVSTIDNRSVGAALADSYSKLTFAEFASNKWQNVRELFIHPADEPYSNATITGAFFCTFQALGLLDLGFLVWLRWPKIPKALPAAESRLLKNLFVISAVSLAFWILVMFEPGSTVVHQGSLATFLALALFCALSLAATAPVYAWLLAAIQAALYPLYLMAKPAFFDQPAGAVAANSADEGSLWALLVAAAALVWLGNRLARDQRWWWYPQRALPIVKEFPLRSTRGRMKGRARLKR